MDDCGGSGGGSGAYDERRAPLEDSDHLAVHCVHIFMQNLYHYATQNTVRVSFLRWLVYPLHRIRTLLGDIWVQRSQFLCRYADEYRAVLHGNCKAQPCLKYTTIVSGVTRLSN